MVNKNIKAVTAFCTFVKLFNIVQIIWSEGAKSAFFVKSAGAAALLPSPVWRGVCDLRRCSFGLCAVVRFKPLGVVGMACRFLPRVERLVLRRCVCSSAMLSARCRSFLGHCAWCFAPLPCCFPSRCAVRALNFACIALLLALAYSYRGKAVKCAYDPFLSL